MIEHRPIAVGARRLVVLVAAAVTLAACTTATAPTTTMDPQMVQGVWELTSGEVHGSDLKPPDGYPITLIIEERRLGGTAACNGYGSDFVLDGAAITIRELGQTSAACGPPEVMEAEATFLAGLAAVDTVEVSEQSLRLAGPEVELTFAQREEVDERAFVDVEWRLVEMMRKGVSAEPGGEPAMLLMAGDGTVSGSTGCRDLAGQWAVFGRDVLFPTFGAEGDCPADLAAQDSHVVTVLGDGFQVRLDGDRLMLSSVGDDVLVYERAAPSDR